MQALEFVWNNGDTIIRVATGTVTVASLITLGTNTPAPETWLGKAYKIIEALALVVGKAKDK